MRRFYKWESRYGGLEVSEAKRLRAIEEENTKLKRLSAEAILDNAALNDLLGKNGDARRVAGSGGASARKFRNERAAGVSTDCCGSIERALSPAASKRWLAARAAEGAGPPAPAVWRSAPLRAVCDEKTMRSTASGSTACTAKNA
jgi:hypothetical protein